MPKTKSKRQVRFLFSKGSPLTGAQKSKLEGELHSGKVKIKGSRRKKRTVPRPDRHGYY